MARRVRVGRSSLCLVVILGLGGCLGEDGVVVPRPDASPGSRPPLSWFNTPPVATITAWDPAGQPARHSFTGQNLTLNASTSTDPDGRIVRFTWELAEAGRVDPLRSGSSNATLNVSYDTPGRRAAYLWVEDDRGAVGYASWHFVVHERNHTEGVLAPRPAPLPADTVAAASLAAQPGLLALVLNVTFDAPPVSEFQAEIRDPDGRLINRTEGPHSRLVGVAMGPEFVPGSYTAHVRLLVGAAATYRLEFIAWYGE